MKAFAFEYGSFANRYLYGRQSDALMHATPQTGCGARGQLASTTRPFMQRKGSLESMRVAMERGADSMPTHEQFIAGYCPAPVG
jgi:hypothetical protein